MPRIQRKYFNFENQLTIDLLPFNQETLEKIRLERECMEKDIEGSILSRSEIDHYLVEGFTVITYQADYVLEGYDFAYDDISSFRSNRKDWQEEMIDNRPMQDEGKRSLYEAIGELWDCLPQFDDATRCKSSAVWYAWHTVANMIDG